MTKLKLTNLFSVFVLLVAAAPALAATPVVNSYDLWWDAVTPVLGDSYSFWKYPPYATAPTLRVFSSTNACSQINSTLYGQTSQKMQYSGVISDVDFSLYDSGTVQTYATTTVGTIPPAFYVCDNGVAVYTATNLPYLSQTTASRSTEYQYNSINVPVNAGDYITFDYYPGPLNGVPTGLYANVHFVYQSSSTTQATTTQQVDNSNEDFFFGVIIFFMTMVVIIWIFKKR